MNHDIYKSLAEILKKYMMDKSLIETMTDDTLILKDLKINSARIIDIILDIEDEFDIEIDDTAMEEILRIKDIINVIKRKSKAV